MQSCGIYLLLLFTLDIKCVFFFFNSFVKVSKNIVRAAEPLCHSDSESALRMLFVMMSQHCSQGGWNLKVTSLHGNY